jgi:uncharacterized protein YjbI with pentapeptide repeats
MTSALDPQVIETPGPARSTNELREYARRHPCICGEASIDNFEYVSGRLDDGRKLAMYRGLCPSCGRSRRISSWLFRYPDPRREFHLAGVSEPSFIIGPHEFLAAVLPANLAADPDTLPLPEWDEQFDRNVAALRGINELAKFLPEGAREIPDEAYKGEGWPAARAAHPECYTRAWIEPTQVRLAEQRRRFEMTMERMAALRGPEVRPAAPKPMPFTAASLDAHLLWTKKGGRGEGTRLTVAEYDASGARLAAKILSGLIADHVVFDRADFSMADLDAAELTGCAARDASFGSTKLVGSTLVRCAFDRANMTLCKLGDSTIIECSFDGAHLDRSTWYRTQVRESSFRGAVFGNAAFDNAVFTDCDFRGADFSLLTPDLLGTILDARFERCDLRDTKWAGRSLYRGRFVDCKFGGSSGPPASVTMADFENPDLSDDGSGSRIVTRNDLCRYWRMDMDKVRAEEDGVRAYWIKRLTDDGMDPSSPAFAARLEEMVRHPDAKGRDA